MPWFVGGGAEHSPQVARLLAHAAFGGKEGIIGPADCQVKEMAVPGPQVRVLPGAAAIRNRAAGAEYEMYAGRLPTQDTVDIAPTGVGEVRHDMIAAVVMNPYQPGENWPAVADPKVGPYIDTMVLPNVGSTAETIAQAGYDYSGIALARVRIPASTGTIDQSMITDLRRLSNPRMQTIQRIINLPDSAPADVNGGLDWRVWPNAANWQVRIPEWATLCQIKGTMSGSRLIDVGAAGGQWVGQIRVQHGDLYTAPAEVNLDVIGGGGATQSAPTFMCAGDLYIPADHRGTTRDLSFQSWRRSNEGASLQADWGTTVVIEVTYYEEPDLQGWAN